MTTRSTTTRTDPSATPQGPWQESGTRGAWTPADLSGYQPVTCPAWLDALPLPKDVNPMTGHVIATPDPVPFHPSHKTIIDTRGIAPWHRSPRRRTWSSSPLKWTSPRLFPRYPFHCPDAFGPEDTADPDVVRSNAPVTRHVTSYGPPLPPDMRTPQRRVEDVLAVIRAYDARCRAQVATAFRNALAMS